MPSSFQSRNAGSPSIRSGPSGGSFLSHETRRLPTSSTGGLVEEIGGGTLDVTAGTFELAGFAVLLSRLTRQDIIDVSNQFLEVAHFTFEGEHSFREVVAQALTKAKVSAEEISKRAKEQGVAYQILADVDESQNATVDPHVSLRLVFSSKEAGWYLSSPSGVWQEETLRSWSGFLQTLLAAAAQNSELPVNQLPLWDESTAHEFYGLLNATDRAFPGPDSVPGLIAAQVERRPDAIAVISAGQRYTYGELDQRSTRLAEKLVATGAAANRAVAVCMERSVDLPVALVAVLKSGAFYVPLDPHNPSLRLRGILDECQPVAMISDSRTFATFSSALETSAIRVIYADTQSESDLSLEAGSGSSFRAVEVLASDLAYTIYTSGTTGKPKGVRITHGSLLNLICSMARSPGAKDSDRTLAVAPISFDIATMDMFLPLATGGTLVLASRSDAIDPFRLDDLLKEHAITCMQATPATWRMLVASGWSGKRDLKMITGGEAIARELANDLLRLGGELWNCYGPTETTIYSAIVQLRSEAGIVPVGPPMPNTSFYVMDQAGKPLPPGVPGELYIGGAGVSPGYVNRPELTAQRFVPDRFKNAGETLFATGDLVKLVESKGGFESVSGYELEFYGRLDHQVKLRGFRIELGEIESVLRAHPSLSDAVVVLREDVAGEPRLAAYIISTGEVAGAAALREHAAKSLPEYMLPSVIVTLDSYPLSASGKIDRRALPVPESLTGQIVPDHPQAAAALGKLETKLLSIFHEVLRNNSIGVTDSFFQFGGYSLLTVRLFQRIDRELHVRLPISLLFDAPTVRELARVIQKGAAPSVIVPIRPQGTSAPLFIVQSYLLYNVMLEVVEADRPIYGVREMGDETEPMSVEERAHQFSREILNVYSHGPLYLAGWCAAGTLTVEIARQLRAAGHTVGLVALFDAERPGFAPPGGVRAWFSRLWKKIAFHVRRIHTIPWSQRFTYLFEAMERNWEWAVEAYYTAHFGTMFWLQKRFGFSLSDTAFNNVYASLSALKDFTVRPYPGKLKLFRAADVPNFTGVDSTLGWGTIALEGVDVNFVPGDHVSMFKKPHVASLAERLQSELKKSERQLAARQGVPFV